MNNILFEENSFFDINKIYNNNPVKCKMCGKEITLKKYYKQFENEYKFCSKGCEKEFLKEYNLKCNPKLLFSSQTEKILFTYLYLSLPQVELEHNLRTLIPPYELDIVGKTIFGETIVIEYNGSLHYKNCTKYSKKIEKRIINDNIKVDKICNEKKLKLLRICSELGIYSKKELFKEILLEIKESIKYLIKIGKVPYGICYDIIINKEEKIFITERTFI